MDSYITQMRQLVGSRKLILPGTTIIIENHRGDVLLQMRGDFKRWGVPGGIVEEDESLVDNIRREALEETGLTVGEMQPYGMATDPAFQTVTYPNGDICQFHVLHFHTRDWTGDLRCDGVETLELGWFPTDGLPTMLGHMTRAITAFDAYRETGKFQIF